MFEGAVLKTPRGRLLSAPAPGETVFSLDAGRLYRYAQGNPDGPFDVSLVVDTVRLNLTLIYDQSRAHIREAKHFLHLAGEVKGIAGSKVWLSLTPESVQGVVSTPTRVFKISLLDAGGKFVPGWNTLKIKKRPKVPVRETPDTEQTCTDINVNVGCLFDSLFLDHFSNFQNPATAAESFISSAVNWASVIWYDLDDRVILTYVRITGPYDPVNLNYSDFALWKDSLLEHWSIQHNCLRKDGILHFTGRDIGVKGVRNNNTKLCEDINFEKGQRASIIGVPNNSWDATESGETAAHELGHQFGLGHEDVDCSINCGSFPLFMCTQYGDSVALSACMRSDLNSLFNSSSRCDCLADLIWGYGVDNCARCTAGATSLVSDNPTPAPGCVGTDTINFTAVLEGGCDPVPNAKIRARYDPKLMKAALDANGKVISSYFTHEESVVVGGIVIWKELVARDANGNEIGSTFNMDSVKTITFTTVLDLQSGVQLPPKSVQVYLGAADNNAAYTAINPYIDRVVQSGQSFNDVLNPNDPLIVNYRYFHIVGDLELPHIPTNPSTGTTTYSLQDFHLRMDSGDIIHVEPDVLLRLNNTDLAGCATFWQGIELDEGASLEAKSSNVADAQYGIRSTGRTRLEVRNCTFDNNNTGIRIAVPPGYYQPNLVLLGNAFDNSAPLKTAYSGQSPSPAARGYAGICVEGVNAVNISGLPGTGSVTSSRFRNLLNGVVALRSNVSVTQSLFENIQRAALPSGYPLAVSGKGIYASGGRLVVQGALVSGGLPVEFDSCHTAIQTQAAAMDVVECTMTRVHNGIVAGGGADRPYRVAWNDIEAIDRGISVHYQFGLPGRASIDHNTVAMSGNAQGVAIATGGTDLLQQWGGYLGNNVVTLDAGATGILIGAAAGLDAAQNNISLAGDGALFGIRMEGGDRNTLRCNTVTNPGEGDNDGLYAIHPDRSAFLCNSLDGSTRGLHFEGMLGGKSKALVARNTMNGNGTGLLLGMDAVIGEQRHTGNRWSGSGTTVARHLTPQVAENSEFFVDAAEDAEYLPSVVVPQIWFTNQSTQGDTNDECETGYTCPTASIAPPQDSLERKIAKGELPGEAFQAAQQWLAQRRLRERIGEEGNPYPNDTVYTNFLISTQSNGLAKYANLQFGLRAMFALDSADLAGLEIYAAGIAQYLSDLRDAEKQINTPGIDEQDSIDLAEMRDSVLLELEQLSNQEAGLLEDLQDNRDSSAAELVLQNDDLEGSAPYQSNEKWVNEILLVTIAQSVYSFTEGQIDTLEVIANTCPLSDGEAVLKARAMLALIDGGMEVYDDTQLCDPGEERSMATMKGQSFRVYPNPANTEVIVECELAAHEESTLLLFNVLGQIVKGVTLTEKANKTVIPVNSLPSGIYWYSLPTFKSTNYSGKIIIQH